MLLRTRIIVFVLWVVSTVAGLVFFVGSLREREMSERVAELQLSQLDQAWSFAVSGIADRISAKLDHRVALSPALADAVVRDDRHALATFGATHFSAQHFLQSDIYASSGDVLWSSAEVLNPVPLIGVGHLAGILRDSRSLVGARALTGGHLAILGCVALSANGKEEVHGRPVGLLAAAVPLSEALSAFQSVVGGRVYAQDLNGQLLFGRDDNTWRAAQTHFKSWQRSLSVLSHDNYHDEAAVLPVMDMTGGRLATLLIVRDVTEHIENRVLWDKASLLAVASAFAVAILFLYLYLRRSFETLSDAVDALRDLSHGSYGGYVELPRGADEIGQIAEAVEVFGQAVQTVKLAGEQRERRQRRQQRYIRRQMEQLATTLKEEARRELLSELSQIESSACDADSAQSKAVGDELGLIALGFSRLATKVGVQQTQLSQLVRELREALEDKRKLISLQQELEIAANMQLSILPQRFPNLPMLDLAAYMHPAKEVGGDFYDIFEVRDGVLALVVADVSGKGIPAAFFMLISRTMLRTVAVAGAGPAKTLFRLNNQLSAENEQMMFVTVFYAEIELATGVVTYCSGGHNLPVVARADGRLELVERTAGIALATFPDIPFGEKVITLGHGDTLFLYTDGVTEAFAADGAMFGEKRLCEVLAETPPASANAALQRVISALADFTVGAEQSDDITGVAARWRARI
jgi:sigma-B regulation protein RsbU (phosphoserine phosphatase)